jgi:hypothetical protein
MELILSYLIRRNRIIFITKYMTELVLTRSYLRRLIQIIKRVKEKESIEEVIWEYEELLDFKTIGF